MPISNYVIPGVYVSQSGTSLSTVNNNNLNIAIVADQPTPGATTDTFTVAVPTSGTVIGQLTTPMVNTTSTGAYASYSGFTVTWASGNTTVTGTYGVNFNISTPSGGPYSYLTTSGISASTGLPSGTIGITYGHAWGAYGTYYSFNNLSQVVGAAVSGTTVLNPATLAAQFAFQNGASTVSVMPVARISSSGTGPAAYNDWARVFVATSGTTSDPTYLMNLVGVDVIVPLYSFVSTSGATAGQIIPYGASTVASGINTYLNNQQQYGILQRAFVGVDGTANGVTASQMQALASGFNSTRVTLSYPPLINYNPGFNPTTGLSTASFNIPGYYVAAALAGLYTGQPTVATPITNKNVNGFNSIPNQISDVDAATNYLTYGITVVRQKRDGYFWVYQGLTTNTTSWVTQEISINAISDQLAKAVKSDLVNSKLIGGPLTNVTSAAVLGTVQATLTSQLSNGLIQAYQNLALSLNPATPTTVNVTFQYAPTYPINYIQVTMSLNTQTGTVITQNAQSNFVVY